MTDPLTGIDRIAANAADILRHPPSRGAWLYAATQALCLGVAFAGVAYVVALFASMVTL